MKLRNKKTGETVDYISFEKGGGQISMYVFDTNKHYYYNSLAELIEEWEDVSEEPVSINEIDVLLEAIEEYCNEHSFYVGELKKIKLLNIVGNKLKAWQRLKDKGLSFRHWKEAPLRPHSSCIAITGNMECDEEARKDLDLLFGGEE